MNYNFQKWEKEKDKEKLKEDINYKIKSLYMNQLVEEVHEIFNSQWKDYIDLSYDKGSILEFASMVKTYKEKDKAINELKFLIKDIENKKLDNSVFKQAIHNVLLTALNFNNVDMIVFITKEQKICSIDFNYANCALITNCFPKNNSSKKREIFNYFIMECDLLITPDIERNLKKEKRTDILELINKVSLYHKINNKLPDTKDSQKKIKI